jgi:hypothetical protein
MLLFLGSAFAIAAFTLPAAQLITGGHPLDPVEAAVLARAEGFAEAGISYQEPSQSAPSLMPGFPLAVLPLVQTFGARPWEPRALALLITLLIASLAMTIVRLETESWTLAVTSVGFLALGYSLLAAPPGIARPELLMLLLGLLAFLVLRLTHGNAGAVLAAVLCSAAFFCDPQAAWYIAAAACALALEDRRRLLVFTLVVGVLVGGGHVALSWLLGPWFNSSVWGNPLQSIRWNLAEPLRFVGDHLLGRLGMLTLAAVLSFALPIAPWRGKGGLWMWMSMAALGAGLISTQTAGFGPATLVPSLVVLALVGPISMHRVMRQLAAWPGSSRIGGQGVVLTALTLQFIMFLSASQALPGVSR